MRHPSIAPSARADWARRAWSSLALHERSGSAPDQPTSPSRQCTCPRWRRRLLAASGRSKGQTCCIIRSCLVSLHKQGDNLFDALAQAISGLTASASLGLIDWGEAYVTEKLRKYLLTCFANCYKSHPDKINRKTTLAARSTMEQATPAYQNFLGTDEHAVKTKIWIATATSPSPKTSAFTLQPS